MYIFNGLICTLGAFSVCNDTMKKLLKFPYNVIVFPLTHVYFV